MPPLKVPNEYGSNMDFLYGQQLPTEVTAEAFDHFLKETGLDYNQIMGTKVIQSLDEVDEWKKEYVYAKSLYNPSKLSDLGNQWYMRAYKKIIVAGLASESETITTSVAMTSCGSSVMSYTSYATWTL